MASYGDFSSLLQLGVGIGIGLSLFRAPVDVRVARLTRTIDNELTVLKNAHNAFGREKWRAMRQLRLEFGKTRDELDRTQVPFMWAAIGLALLNLAALVVATLEKDRPACGMELCALLLITIGGFFVLLLALEGLARWRLGPIRRDLNTLRARVAPPAAAAAAYLSPPGPR